MYVFMCILVSTNTPVYLHKLQSYVYGVKSTVRDGVMCGRCIHKRTEARGPLCL